MYQYTIKTINRNTLIQVVSVFNLPFKNHKIALKMAKYNHNRILQEQSNLSSLTIKQLCHN